MPSIKYTVRAPETFVQPFSATFADDEVHEVDNEDENTVIAGTPTTNFTPYIEVRGNDIGLVQLTINGVPINIDTDSTKYSQDIPGLRSIKSGDELALKVYGFRNSSGSVTFYY